MQAAEYVAPTSHWQPLFNGKDLSGWDTWLGPRSSGYVEPSNSRQSPIGLNNDPLQVFTVVEKDGAPAIRISGEIFGAITTHSTFSNVHIRVEYKWGDKKWPPRAEARHYRDSGILYWCIGKHGAGSSAWMRSVECNIMEKGVGQWWSVAGSYIDIEGRKVVLDKAPQVPYRGESAGEECIIYERGAPQFTTSEGVTSLLDPERPGEWNVCEVFAWGNFAVHVLNGKVVLALANPRFKENGREVALAQGKIQLQSEGAEVFYRKVEVRPLYELPSELHAHLPPSAPDETGFQPLFGKDANDGWRQAGPGSFQLQNGIATGLGGMGLWWHTNRMYTNFVLRGEFVQEQAAADSGVFFRFPEPGNDPWVAVNRGHEVELGDEKSEHPTWWTGSIYPFHAPTRVPVKPAGQWNHYEIVCFGHSYLVRLNGEVINTWTDDTQRSTAGYIGLQNYDDGKVVRHRNLRIKALPEIAP